MLKCSGCGAQIANGVKFCSLCGKPAQSATAARPVASNSAAAGPYRPPVADNAPQQRNALFITGGAIVLALVLFLLLKASGVLGAKGTEVPTAAVLTAPQTKVVDAPLLNVPEVKASDAPVLSAPKSNGHPMPEDVIAYLRWLKQFEAARRSLEFRGNAAYMKLPTMLTMKMMAEMDENNPDKKQSMTSDVAAEIGGVVQEMNAATQRFQAYPPPNPCAALATGYNRSLSTKVRQMAKMQIAVAEIFKMFDSQGNTNGAAQDMLPQLLQEMTTRSMSQEADAADLAANEALNAVRGQYTDIPQDIDGQHFDIRQVDLKIDPRSVIPPGMGSGLGI